MRKFWYHAIDMINKRCLWIGSSSSHIIGCCKTCVFVESKDTPKSSIIIWNIVFLFRAAGTFIISRP